MYSKKNFTFALLPMLHWEFNFVLMTNSNLTCSEDHFRNLGCCWFYLDYLQNLTMLKQFKKPNNVFCIYTCKKPQNEMFHSTSQSAAAHISMERSMSSFQPEKRCKLLFELQLNIYHEFSEIDSGGFLG